MSIFHDYLCVRKWCARWIPHSQTDKQWLISVEWCKFKLRKFNGGRPKWTWEVRTGDETWSYQYDPETTMQSVIWLFLDKSPPPKLKRLRSTQKKMKACFFGKSGHVATIPLEDSWQSLRTGTCITVSQRSSKFGTSAAERRDSAAFFFFFMTMPMSTQQQQQLTFSTRARCSCCCTHRIHQTSLPQRLPTTRSEETTEAYSVWECRRCMLSVHEGCWRHTQISLGRGEEQVVSPHGKVHSCWKKVLWKDWVILFLVSPIRNEYPETIGASLRTSYSQISKQSFFQL